MSRSRRPRAMLGERKRCATKAASERATGHKAVITLLWRERSDGLYVCAVEFDGHIEELAGAFESQEDAIQALDLFVAELSKQGADILRPWPGRCGSVMARTEQAEQLERVTDRISSHVLAFVARVGAGNTFHAADLVEHVTAATGDEAVAPDSPSRILRALRRKRTIDYKVESRSSSLYRVLRTVPAPPSAVGQLELFGERSKSDDK